MKTTTKNTIAPATRTTRLVAILTTVIALAGSQAAMARGWWSWRPNPCKVQAHLAYQSEASSARADYLLELGKAENIHDRGDRNEARDEAREAWREALAEARDILAARLDLCREIGVRRYCPEIDPDDFCTPEEAAAHPNPYWLLVPGRVLTYNADTEEGPEIIVVEVTQETREVMGVECTVVVDTVWVDGEIIEDTEDWYAQDKDGNVWYFGEFSLSYEDGELVGLEGSWEAGVDGAKPGILFPGDPEPGRPYRQEFLLGEAEDIGQVLSLDETVTTELDTFTGCVKTADTTPLETDSLEHKFYAPGVGLVLEVKPDSDEAVELVQIDE